MRKQLTWCLFTSFLMVSSIYAQPGKPDKGPANVVVSNVVKIKRAGYESFIGTLQASRKSIVGTAVDGRVIKMFVDTGDPILGSSTSEHPNVFGGQPLVQLRTNTLKIEIATATIQLELAQQSLSELTAALPNDLKLAESKSSEAAARLLYAEAEYGRLKQMSEAAVSKLEIDAARSEYEVNKQLAVTATIQLERFKSLRSIRVAKATSLVATAEQEVARLNDLLEKYTIRAPFNGFVTAKMTEVGTWATKGMPLLEVVQLDPIQLIVDVPQAYIGQLQNSLLAHQSDPSGAKAELQFEGIEQSITGRIKRIVPKADLKMRTFPVRIEIDNPKRGNDYLLKPGMLGRASLSIGTPVEMLMVKKDSLVLGSGPPCVLKIENQAGKTTTTKVPVKTGSNIGAWIQIIGDVHENDQVVIQGNERLQPGQTIMISETDLETVPEH